MSSTASESVSAKRYQRFCWHFFNNSTTTVQIEFFGYGVGWAVDESGNFETFSVYTRIRRKSDAGNNKNNSVAANSWRSGKRAHRLTFGSFRRYNFSVFAVKRLVKKVIPFRVISTVVCTVIFAGPKFYR